MGMDVADIVPHLADAAFATRWSRCAAFGLLAPAQTRPHLTEFLREAA
jgi:hypothetical protein